MNWEVVIEHLRECATELSKYETVPSRSAKITLRCLADALERGVNQQLPQEPK